MCGGQCTATMKITREQVDYVAHLGRLALTSDEKTKFMAQLDDILKYMDMLAAVDTDEVNPMSGPVEFYTPMREDTVKASLAVEEALANAPARTENFLRVPRVID